jgi:P27 family predicted phage terminase small subunit
MLKDTRPPTHPAPKHLGKDEKDLWNRLTASYVLDDPASLALLQQACEARMRARLAAEIILKEGSVYTDDRGNLKSHPAVAAERSAQNAFISSMRLLRLDISGEQRK